MDTLCGLYHHHYYYYYFEWVCVCVTYICEVGLVCLGIFVFSVRLLPCGLPDVSCGLSCVLAPISVLHDAYLATTNKGLLEIVLWLMQMHIADILYA